MSPRRILILSIALTALSSAPAWADAPVRHHWSGDIRHFGSHDYPTWRTGNWHHGRHDGRLGWWWVVGGLWYVYPGPIYPYPDPYVPPVVVVSPPAAQVPDASASPPAPQYWYYCDASKAYYPYVTSCPGGWKPVPATRPGQ